MTKVSINKYNGNIYKLNGSKNDVKNVPSNLSFYFSCHTGTSASKHITYDQLVNRILLKMDECCTKPVVLKCMDFICREELRGLKEQKYTTSEKCGNRLCQKEACLNSRKAKTIKKYTAMYKNMRYPRFLTLTYAGYHELNYETRKDLTRHWKALSQWLRRTNQKRKKSYMSSYIMALELVEKEYCKGTEYKRAGYYYHMHIIYDGHYIPFDDLQRQWKRITKTSHRVRIEPIRTGNKIEKYITKYISKGSELFANVHEFIKVRKMQFFSSYCPLYCPNCEKRINTRKESIEGKDGVYLCNDCGYEFKTLKLVIPPFEEIICDYCHSIYKFDFLETDELREKSPT